MWKKESVMKNFAKEGITQLQIIISTIGPCWSVSKRPNDEELREVVLSRSGSRNIKAMNKIVYQ
jgi:hypothetical protein